MIAAVKGWYAALSALVLLAPGAMAADDLNGAAAILALKTAAFAGRGEAVAVSYRNISSLGSAELGQMRTAFEGALRDAGCRPVDSAAVTEARVSISENASQYLLVEEARKGEDRQVFFASWTRAAAGWAATRALKLARFGDNMRFVAVTEGDKTEAESVFGVQVNTWSVNELVAAVDSATDAEIDAAIERIRNLAASAFSRP